MKEKKAESLLIEMRGITKVFPGVKALDNVDFNLRYGEIHALLGGNGAGKSTLIKVLTGVEKPDSGKIFLMGHEVTIRSPRHAQELGISTVYQEVNLCPNLSVAENILIGRQPMIRGCIDWKEMNSQAAGILKRILGIDIDVTQLLGSYSVAIQQMVAIARALEIESAKVLILDEPTSSLTTNETEQLFSVMRKLKSENVGIIFITHFLDQVYEVSDRITVIRNGKLISCDDTASLSKMDLIIKMIGRTIADLDEMVKIKNKTTRNVGKENVLKATDFGRMDWVEPMDLNLHDREVLGLAGLVGSGRTETALLLFGVDSPDSGSLEVGNRKIRKYSPNNSIHQGIALSPEDRKAAGIIDDLTVRENIILALQAGRGWFKHLNSKNQTQIADKFIKLLDISTPTAEQLVRNLSGGNQQKVILARWLAINPRVLILDEPTRGIDVGTKAEIQKLVLTLAEEGKSVIFISSELEEVMRCSHRISVLSDKKKIAEFSGQVDEHVLLETMAGSG
ncbi:MAG: sugar ABC transporter ATP-binding protein [Anaerolineaceae bacterium]|nr:sugar ABC transporter ATP-binding protein [Anaerolineaceae bacterium]MBN2677851.1 sugar ABC transporter ATP-binding protein [Anaerolineaceae bacterium]